MSQFTASEGQPGNWEEPDFFLRPFGTARFQAYGWQEPCDGRLSRTDLWERGGEIPLRHPTLSRPLVGFFQTVIPVWYLGFPLIFKTVDYGYDPTIFLPMNSVEYQ